MKLNEFSGTGVAALASYPKPAKDIERKHANSNAPSATVKFHPTSSVDPAAKGLTGTGSVGFNFTMNSGDTAANLEKSRGALLPSQLEVKKRSLNHF